MCQMRQIHSTSYDPCPYLATIDNPPSFYIILLRSYPFTMHFHLVSCLFSSLAKLLHQLSLPYTT